MIQILILVQNELATSQTGVEWIFVMQYVPCLFHHVCSEDMKGRQQDRGHRHDSDSDLSPERSGQRYLFLISLNVYNVVL